MKTLVLLQLEDDLKVFWATPQLNELIENDDPPFTIKRGVIDKTNPKGKRSYPVFFLEGKHVSLTRSQVTGRPEHMHNLCEDKVFTRIYTVKDIISPFTWNNAICTIFTVDEKNGWYIATKDFVKDIKPARRFWITGIEYTYEKQN